MRTTTADCYVDAKCSNAYFGPLSNADTHFHTASRWYKLTVPLCLVGILIGYCLQWHRMAVGEFFQLHLQ